MKTSVLRRLSSCTPTRRVHWYMAGLAWTVSRDGARLLSGLVAPAMRGDCRHFVEPDPVEPVAQPGQLLHPVRQPRWPLGAVQKGAGQCDGLPYRNDAAVDEGNDQDQSNDCRKSQRGPHIPVLAPEVTEPAVVQLRRADCEHNGPAQRRQKVLQHPAAQQHQRADQRISCDLLGDRDVGRGHVESF